MAPRRQGRGVRHRVLDRKRSKLTPSPQTSAGDALAPFQPGNSLGGSGTLTHCSLKRFTVGQFAIGVHLLRILCEFGVEFTSRRAFELSRATTRSPLYSSLPSAALRSTKVAAILPQSRSFSARLPTRQPVTTPMASVAQRSDFDHGDQAFAVRGRWSLLRGSSMPRRC